MPHDQVVVKSQILAGGRGLGTFKSGLKGGVHIVKKEEVEDIAGTELIFNIYVHFCPQSCINWFLLLVKIVLCFCNIQQLTEL